MDKIARELSVIGSANVSDALRSLGCHFQAMDGGIRPLQTSMRLAGPAFTVRCYPGATFALEKALELASPGDVLVVDGGGHPDVILMGGLMSTRAKTRGLAGAVVDGAVRDVDQITSLGFPVFSRYVCPRAGIYAEIGEWQTTICCGRQPVQPGDWIVADHSGVAIVPPRLLMQLLERATALNQREDHIQRELLSGKNLAEAVKAAENNGRS